MTEATKTAWDNLPCYSDTVLSKSDVETAVRAFDKSFYLAAIRTLTLKQLTDLALASHRADTDRSAEQKDAVHEYKQAVRRLSGAATADLESLMSEGEVAEAMKYEPNFPAQGLPVDYGNEPWRTKPETVGDWAGKQIPVKDWNGHTPAGHEALINGVDGTVRFIQTEDTSFEEDLAQHQANHIAAGLAALVQISGENSRDHGFHDDWPREFTDGVEVFPEPEHRSESFKRQIQLAIVEKIALVHEEVSEALGEIRSGHDALEIYYLDKATGQTFSEQRYDENGIPQLKPEGFLVELADAVIRIADLAFLVKGREKLVFARAIKHEYNASREYKHGRKF